MAEEPVVNTAVEIAYERRKLKRSLTLLPLFGIIFFTVCGGSFGIEPLFGWSGPGMALLLIAIMPFVFSIPNMLMVREMNSLMPVEGSYYHWVKQAYGPMPGFLAGWMNWVVSWVDVAIYPVFAAYYLSFFIPQLSDGWGGVPAWVLQWIVALVIIWLISYLQTRGARLAGLTSSYMSIVMAIPLLILTVVGFYNWAHSGSDFQMHWLPQGESAVGAFSTGLFVVMWNYMGWELPTAAGDEIVKPRRTYPLAMVMVLIAAIAMYALPTVAGLYGGGGDDGRTQLWGIEEYESGEGVGVVLEEYGITQEQIDEWGIDATSDIGWELPDIAERVGEKAAGVGSPLARFLGISVMIAAVLSMIGLFIGNSLGGSRIPFALAEDGMMPKWMVRVHPRYGTPWVAILFCGVIFSVFSLNTFATLVVIDVFLNVVVLLMTFAALWRLRFTKPDAPRSRVPGGWLGLGIVTLLPTIVFLLAVYSQIVEEGWGAIYIAAAFVVAGAIFYFPLKKYLKVARNVPDVDPYEYDAEKEAADTNQA